MIFDGVGFFAIAPRASLTGIEPKQHFMLGSISNSNNCPILVFNFNSKS